MYMLILCIYRFRSVTHMNSFKLDTEVYIWKKKYETVHFRWEDFNLCWHCWTKTFAVLEHILFTINNCDTIWFIIKDYILPRGHFSLKGILALNKEVKKGQHVLEIMSVTLALSSFQRFHVFYNNRTNWKSSAMCIQACFISSLRMTGIYWVA